MPAGHAWVYELALDTLQVTPRLLLADGGCPRCAVPPPDHAGTGGARPAPAPEAESRRLPDPRPARLRPPDRRVRQPGVRYARHGRDAGATQPHHRAGDGGLPGCAAVSATRILLERARRRYDDSALLGVLEGLERQAGLVARGQAEPVWSTPTATSATGRWTRATAASTPTSATRHARPHYTPVHRGPRGAAGSGATRCATSGRSWCRSGSSTTWAAHPHDATSSGVLQRLRHRRLPGGGDLLRPAGADRAGRVPARPGTAGPGCPRSTRAQCAAGDTRQMVDRVAAGTATTCACSTTGSTCRCRS